MNLFIRSHDVEVVVGEKPNSNLWRNYFHLKTLFLNSLFLMLFCMSERSYAQSRQHLADSNAVWQMLYIYSDMNLGVLTASYKTGYTYMTNQDTMINGNRMSMLFDSMVNMHISPKVIGYVGEDSMHRVVMIVINKYGNYTFHYGYDSLYFKPLVIADFSKSRGDSFLIYGDFKAYSLGVTYQYIRTDLFAVQHVNYSIGFNRSENHFVNGVGNIKEGIMSPFFDRFETFFRLICYTQNSVELAPDSCDFTLNINEKDISNQFLSTELIYRNNYVIIDFNSLINIDHVNVKIYDLNAQLMNQADYEPYFNKCFIPTNNFSNGIYILEISIPGTSYSVRKKMIVSN